MYYWECKHCDSSGYEHDEESAESMQWQCERFCTGDYDSWEGDYIELDR